MEVNVSPAGRAVVSTQTVALPPRVLGRFGDPTSGPTLIIFGAVHGNEPAGYKAMLSLFADFEEDPIKLRGSVIGLVGNRQALAEGVRFIDADLNRQWVPENIRRIQGDGELHDELAEARELYDEVDDVLKTATENVFALDIHSTSGPGPAFSVFDDSLANRGFALELEVPMVLGIEEELQGTLLDYLNTRGVPSTGFEAGQHDDPASVDRAKAAIWVALRASGVLGRERQREVDEASHLLASAGEGVPRLFNVCYRHAIAPGATFRMRPGLVGFQETNAG
jgi:succinylglutamate desuccinylase